MKILVVGGTGTIGSKVVSKLKENHEVISVGRTSGDYQMDLLDKHSIVKMFEDHQNVDGLISIAGDAELAPYHLQPNEQIDLAINSKLRGNIDLIREASNHLNKGGFIITTSGTASNEFIPGASSVSMALAGLEGYIESIQIEPHNDISVRAIRPQIITETMRAFNLDLPHSVSAKETAEVYAYMVENKDTEVIVNVSDFIKKEA